MISASEFIAKIKSYNPNADLSLIKKAYVFSKTEHGNQKRHSGDPYFSHPLAVAEILIDLKMDQDSIIAALLHDIVEDTEITLEEIEKNFNKPIADLVDGVTKLGKIESTNFKEDVAENFRKLTLAMSKDIRVLLIKLADRLHNMRTLFYVPSKEKKLGKAKESLEIYAPLAARIGLNKIKDEIEELAFQIIDQKNYQLIVEKLNELIERKKGFIEKVIEKLGEKLQAEKVKFEISGRQKTPYSIYKKMKVQNVGFHDLYDIMAFRIIVENIEECYRVLGIINSSYNMIPGTFRDYISTPKDNGYRSIHMAILGPVNKKIEIQIRDKNMHKEAELGLAAHWSYKDSQGKKPSKKIKSQSEIKQYQWVRDLVALFENAQNASEVVDHGKFDVYKNEVFCFTPNGDIFNLPLGATAVDFAYAIHSEIGNSCNAVKINGMIAPLRQKLENGDQIEIITSKNAKPSQNWLQFTMTTKAKSSIRAFLRDEKFEEHRKLGFGILNKFFISKDKKLKEELLEKFLPEFNVKNLDDLYVKVAEGVISRKEILLKIYPETAENNNDTKFKQIKPSKKSDFSIPIDGLIDGMAVHFAGCCNPIPGDNIIGVINTGVGVTVHNQSCKNFKNMVILPQKLIEVYWKSENKTAKFLYGSKISGVLLNKTGSLAEISTIIAKKKVNIKNLRIINQNEDFCSIVLEIEVKNTAQIEDLLITLKNSKNIIEAQRVFN